MRIFFSKNFNRQFRKLNKKNKSKFGTVLELFSRNIIDPALNNHELKGRLIGYNSIDVTGDIRAIYKEEIRNVFYFVKIGTHSELYKK